MDSDGYLRSCWLCAGVDVNNDEAAAYQLAYDQAVYFHGPESEEAKKAEREALAYFQRQPAAANRGTFSNNLEYLA